MRQCPTLRGEERPLIAHSIANALCMERQREFYHKCHRCEFCGKAADFSLPATSEVARPALREQQQEVAPLQVEAQVATGRPPRGEAPPAPAPREAAADAS